MKDVFSVVLVGVSHTESLTSVSCFTYWAPLSAPCVCGGVCARVCVHSAGEWLKCRLFPLSDCESEGGWLRRERNNFSCAFFLTLEFSGWKNKKHKFFFFRVRRSFDRRSGEAWWRTGWEERDGGVRSRWLEGGWALAKASTETAAETALGWGESSWAVEC